jgi:hypothetical protein
VSTTILEIINKNFSFFFFFFLAKPFNGAAAPERRTLSNHSLMVGVSDCSFEGFFSMLSSRRFQIS